VTHRNSELRSVAEPEQGQSELCRCARFDAKASLAALSHIAQYSLDSMAINQFLEVGPIKTMIKIDLVFCGRPTIDAITK